MAILFGLSNFGRGHHGEHFCEIILNLNQWLRRCHLKVFLSRALEAILFSAMELFVYFRRDLNLNQWFRRKCCLKTFHI